MGATGGRSTPPNTGIGTGFGGFGSQPASTTGFGTGVTGFSSLTNTAPAFGAPKPFGATSPTTFGTVGAFGSTTMPQQNVWGSTTPAMGTTPFGTGATTNTLSGGMGLMGGAGAATSGTGNPPFNAPQIKENTSQGTKHLYLQNISGMQNVQHYTNKSQEELRFEDYQKGCKGPGGASMMPQMGGIGSGFAQPSMGFGATATTSAFGAKPGLSLGFGSPAQQQPGQTTFGFGQQTAGSSFPTAFGAQSTTSNASPMFGAQQPQQQPQQQQTFGFGQTSLTQTAPLFGQTTTGTTPAFGSATTTAPFGMAASTPGATSAFGTSPAPAFPQTGQFGSAGGLNFAKPQTTSTFGTTGAFGSPTPAFGGFGTTPSTTFAAPQTAPGSTAFGFGGATATTPAATAPLFGAASTFSLGGQQQNKPALSFTAPATGGTVPAFGAATTTPGLGFPFAAQPAQQPGLGAFGASTSMFPSAMTAPQTSATAGVVGVPSSANLQSEAAMNEATMKLNLHVKDDKAYVEAMRDSAITDGDSYTSSVVYSYRSSQVMRGSVNASRPRVMQSLSSKMGSSAPFASPTSGRLGLGAGMAGSRSFSTSASPSTAQFRPLTGGPGGTSGLGLAAARVESLLSGSPSFSPAVSGGLSSSSAQDFPAAVLAPKGTSKRLVYKDVPDPWKDYENDKEELTNLPPPHGNSNEDAVEDRVHPPPPPPKGEPTGLTPGDGGMYTPQIKTINRFDLNTDSEIITSSPDGRDSVTSQCPKLTREKYYCKPSINDMKNMTASQLRSVRDFTVGKEGIGEISWQESVDVTGINLDNIVNITPGKVTVYPDGSPPVGRGLNKPAKIVLKRIFYEGNPEVMEQYLRKHNEDNDAEFIAYNPENGEWSFVVPHFSSHGLPDFLLQNRTGGGVNLDKDTLKLPIGAIGPPPKSRSTYALPSPPLSSVETPGLAFNQPQSSAKSSSSSSSFLPPNNVVNEGQGRWKGGDNNRQETFKFREASPPAGAAVAGAGMGIVSPHMADKLGMSRGSTPSLLTQARDAYTPMPPLTSGSGMGVEGDHMMISLPFSPGNMADMTEMEILASMRAAEHKKAELAMQELREKMEQACKTFDSNTSPCMNILRKVQRELSQTVPQGPFSSHSSISSPAQSSNATLTRVTVKDPNASSSSMPIKPVDMSLFMGRSFRVGWGPQGQIVHAGAPLFATHTDNIKKDKKLHKKVMIEVVDPLRWYKLKTAGLGQSTTPPPMLFGKTVAGMLNPTSNTSDPMTPIFHKVLNAVLQQSYPLENIGTSPAPLRVNSRCDPSNLDHYNRFLTFLRSCRDSFNHVSNENHPDWNIVKAMDLLLASLGQEDKWKSSLDEVVPLLLSRDANPGGLRGPAYWERRREAIAAWLEDICTHQALKRDPNLLTSSSTNTTAQQRQGWDVPADPQAYTYEKIFNLLTCRKVVEAVEVAEQAGLYRLSILLSQADSDHDAMELLQLQLDSWEAQKADKSMHEGILKIYRLLGGDLFDHPDNDARKRSLLSGLGWVGAIGIIYWYCSGGKHNLADIYYALNVYMDSLEGFNSGEFDEVTKSWKNNIVDRPASDWEKDQDALGACVEYNPSSPLHTQSGLFSLLQALFLPLKPQADSIDMDMDTDAGKVSRNGDSETKRRLVMTSLRSEGFTRDPLDYRASYLLLNAWEATDHENLDLVGTDVSAGVPPLVESSTAAIIRTHMISQLLTQGLWTWAVFVALQIPHRHQRLCAVKDIVLRCAGNVEWEEIMNAASNGKENVYDFIVRRLGIAHEWMHLSTSVLSTYEFDHFNQAISLAKAGVFDVALEVVFRHVAPMCRGICNDMSVLAKAPTSHHQAHVDRVLNYRRDLKVLLDKMVFELEKSQELQQQQQQQDVNGGYMEEDAYLPDGPIGADCALGYGTALNIYDAPSGGKMLQEYLSWLEKLEEMETEGEAEAANAMDGQEGFVSEKQWLIQQAKTILISLACIGSDHRKREMREKEASSSKKSDSVSPLSVMLYEMATPLFFHAQSKLQILSQATPHGPFSSRDVQDGLVTDAVLDDVKRDVFVEHHPDRFNQKDIIHIALTA